MLALVMSLTASVLGEPEGSPSQQRVNAEAQLIVDFLKRAEAYLEVHRKADRSITEVSNSASSEEVVAHQRALQNTIAAARASARQGDIFTQPIRGYFRRQISRALAGPEGASIKRTILEENPGRIRLRVNALYPDTVPVSTMPPQLLAALPKLPIELEFRFLGDRLILLDIHANVVVDYMDSAVP